MDIEKKILRDALVSKEKNQELLAKLERMKAGGSISEQRYLSLKSDYQQKMTTYVSAISSIKSDLKMRLEGARSKVSGINNQLDELNARMTTGELSHGMYKRQRQLLLDDVKAAQLQIPRLTELVEAKSSNALSSGGGLPRWALITTISAAAIIVICGGLIASSWFFNWPPLSIFPPKPPATVAAVPAPSENVTPPSPDNNTKPATPWPDIMASVTPSLVTVQFSDNSSAIGILTDNRTVLCSGSGPRELTAATVFTSSNETCKAKFLKRNARGDLMLLEITDNFTGTPAKLTEKASLQPGDEIATVSIQGTPPATDFKAGKVTYIFNDKNLLVLHTDIPFSFEKGGVVVNLKKEIVGFAGEVTVNIDAATTRKVVTFNDIGAIHSFLKK